MIHKEFAKQIVEKIKSNPDALGLAAGGSWITNELDEYSDLDLILVTKSKMSDSKKKMTDFASKLGNLLNAFTGEHVGEPRLLICMYDNPLLHVDIKFVTTEEFKKRVEDPIVLWEKEKTLTKIMVSTKPEWPMLDFQWIEDRFWIWIHYSIQKIGRGEYFEAIECLSHLRLYVISPLMQIRNGQLPRGLRKVEFTFSNIDLEKLKETVPEYNVSSILVSLEKTIQLYQELRKDLYPDSVTFNEKMRAKMTEFFIETKKKIKENKGAQY
jgi:hypothetical protein